MAIEDRMYDFSVRIAEIVRYLKENESGFPLCDKLLDCVIGAGIFIRKDNYQEAADNLQQISYILEMAVKSGYLTERQSLPILSDCHELLAAVTDVKQ